MKTLKKINPLKSFFFGIAILLAAVSINATLVKHPEDLPSECVSENDEESPNRLIHEIIALMNSRKCFTMEVSSISIKRNSRRVYSFSSFGRTAIHPKNSRSIESPRNHPVLTSFSDRNLFHGDKTKEQYTIDGSQRNVRVWVKFITWGNTTKQLTNVKITKERDGYFITGRYAERGHRSVIYTFAIYQDECLI